MPFNRFRAQLKCEALLSCGTLDDWARKRKNFEDFTLTRTSAKDLVASLEEDSKDLYFKGILTLSEALYGISKCLFSWATVRLYYSIFYFLRCSLATKHYAIIRNKSLYLLRAKEGEKPQKKNQIDIVVIITASLISIETFMMKQLISYNLTPLMIRTPISG